MVPPYRPQHAAHNAAGFDAFKVGWGERTVPYDMARQVDRAVAHHEEARALLGPDRALMIDAAGMFDPARAHALIARLRPLAEYGRNKTTVKPNPESRKRSNWRRLPLTFDTIRQAAARARMVLGKRPGLIAALASFGVSNG